MDENPQSVDKPSEGLDKWSENYKNVDEKALRAEITDLIKVNDFDFKLKKDKGIKNFFDSNSVLLYIQLNEKLISFHNQDPVNLRDKDYIIVKIYQFVISLYMEKEETTAMIFKEIKENCEPMDELNAMLHKFYEYSNHDDVLMNTYAQSLFKQILVLICITLDSDDRYKENDTKNKRDKFHKILITISNHVERTLNAQMVADKLSISVQYVNRLCREFYGITFSQCLNTHRLEHSRIFLQHFDKSIQEVAEKSGFNDSAYYVNKFNKAFNITPLQFRKLASLKNPNIEDRLRLHRTNDLQELKLIPEFEAYKSSNVQSPQFFCMICNLTETTIKYYWVNPEAEERIGGSMAKDERDMIGSAANQYYVIRDENDRFITSFLTLNAPSIVYITESDKSNSDS